MRFFFMVEILYRFSEAPILHQPTFPGHAFYFVSAFGYGFEFFGLI